MSAEIEPRMVFRKLTGTRQKERGELLEMAIIGSVEDDDMYASKMHIVTFYLDHELTYCNRTSLEDVPSPLQYWLDKSKSVSHSFPVLTRLALTLFSVSAMSAECRQVLAKRSS